MCNPLFLFSDDVIWVTRSIYKTVLEPYTDLTGLTWPFKVRN